MSQRGEETERQRRREAQRRGGRESTTPSERREVALPQRRQSTPSAEVGNERTRGPSRDTALNDSFNRDIPFPLVGGRSIEDPNYRENISDDEVEGESYSTAPGDAPLPRENESQPANLDDPSGSQSTEARILTLAMARGSDGLVRPGDAPAPQDSEYQTSNLAAPSTLHSAWTEYTSRVATHNNNSTYECQYIMRNMSRVLGEIAKNREQIEQLQSRPPHLRSVVAWMKNRLDNAKVDSVYQDLQRAFIPCTRLYAIVNEYTVNRALEELSGNDQTPSTVAEVERLTQIIAPPISELARVVEGPAQYRRVFAVLIMIRKAECIFDFLRDEVDDTYMCDRAVRFELPEHQDEEELQRAYAKFPEPCQDRMSWSNQDIRDFRDKRWEVSPPFFSANGSQTDPAAESSQPGNNKPSLTHYELPSSDFILPFLRERRKPATNGASSQLEFYRFHEDQYDGRRYTIHKKKHPIAVKRLEDKRQLDHPRDLTNKFQSERYVLQRLTLGKKSSEHLVKLLATFEILGENSPTKYHFIFEAADGTIKTLWNRDSIWKGADKAALSRWAARQCHGLAGALAQFHTFQSTTGDKDPKTKGMHGDIKPDNVLWYKDWDVGGRAAGEEEPLGILQIADFGLSSFHSTGTVFDVKIIASHDYTAPETECWLRHPPPSDVWALGCLFLDFATWLVNGPDGYNAFVKKRGSRGPLLEKRPRFSTFDQVETDMVEVAVSRKVLEYAESLHESRKASRFVRDLISLVLHHMLVVEHLRSVTSPDRRHEGGGTRRMASGRVRDRLKRMIEHGRRNSAYYAPSKPGKDFKYLKPSDVRLTMTQEELREDIFARHGAVEAEIAADEG